MGNYGTDRAWSDTLIPIIRQIVGPFLLVESPLNAALDAGLVTRKQIAAASASGTSDAKYREACRWVAGESEPTLSEFLCLMKLAPTALKESLAELVSATTGMEVLFVEPICDAEADLNGNGKPDMGDLVMVVARGMGEHQQGAVSETLEASDDRVVTPQEAAELLRPLNACGRMGLVAKHLLTRLTMRPC